MKLPKISFIYFTFAVALFFPTRFFDFYHMLLIGCLIVIAGAYGFRVNKDRDFIYIFSLIVLIVISIFIGIFLYQSDPIRNFTEIIRFIPLLILFFSLRKAKSEDILKCMKNILFLYSLLCFVLSLLQVNSVPFVDTITDLYGALNHIEISLGISSRALGFSSGPGQNGVIMTVIFAFSLGQALISEDKLQSSLTALFSFIVVVLSQSQTAFIVTIGVSLYSLLYSIFFLNKKYKIQAFRYFSFILPVGFFSILYFQDKLRYLFSLFSQGLQRNSFQARVRKTDYIYDLTTDNAFSFLFGHGKDYFDAVSAAMDNEYMFYLGVYGLLATSIIVLVFFYFLIKPYFSDIGLVLNNKFYFSLHLIILAGVVMAWPSAFILDPRVFFILSFLYVMYKRDLLESSMLLKRKL